LPVLRRALDETNTLAGNRALTDADLTEEGLKVAPP
jgi:hypothetical protein